MTLFALFWIGWFVAGFIGWGLSFAYFQGDWPDLSEKWYWIDLLFAISIFFFGYVGLVATLSNMKKYHGFKWF